MRRNEDTDEDSSTQTEENEPSVGLNQSSNLLSNDVIKIELFFMKISLLIPLKIFIYLVKFLIDMSQCFLD